jgi:hypothetical protein
VSLFKEDKGLAAILAHLRNSNQQSLQYIEQIREVLSVSEGEGDLSGAGGPIRFGRIPGTRIIAGFRYSDTPRFNLILGQPGVGKSTATDIIVTGNIDQALNAGIEQINIIFDLVKRDHEHLATHFHGVLSPEQMIVLRVRRDLKNNLFDNPYDPPSDRIKLSQWLAIMNDTIRDATGLRDESGSVLLGAITEAAKGLNGEPPSLYHLILTLRKMKPKGFDERSRYFSRAEHRIFQILTSAPRTFACTRGMFRDLMKYLLVIIDLTQVGSFCGDFVVQTFLTKLLWYSQAEQGLE